MENQTILATGLSNQEFVERHAQPGRVGLCGGATRLDIAIRRAQRHLDDAGRWSDWSHAFLFYFTHPGRRPGAPRDGTEQRRSSIQVVELQLKDGMSRQAFAQCSRQSRGRKRGKVFEDLSSEANWCW